MEYRQRFTRFYPPEYGADFTLYSRFPSEEAIDHMRRRGLSAVVVHVSEYPPERQNEFLRHPSLVRCFGTGCVFAIR